MIAASAAERPPGRQRSLTGSREPCMISELPAAPDAVLTVRMYSTD